MQLKLVNPDYPVATDRQDVELDGVCIGTIFVHGEPPWAADNRIPEFTFFPNEAGRAKGFEPCRAGTVLAGLKGAGVI
jgi:hypothetical protein